MRTYSFRGVLKVIVALFVCFGLLITFLAGRSITATSRERIYAQIASTLNANGESIRSSISDVEKYMSEVYYYSSDLTVLTTSQDPYETVNSLVRLRRMLMGTLPSFSAIDGLFMYFPLSNHFLAVTTDNEGSKIAEALRIAVRAQVSEAGLDGAVTDRWVMREVEGSLCLERINRVQGILIGAFTRLGSLDSRITAPYQHVAHGVLLYRQDGSVCYSSLPGATQTVFSDQAEENRFQDQSGQSYYSIPLGGVWADARMVVLIDDQVEKLNLAPVYWLMGLMMGLMVLLALATALLFSRLISAPYRAVEAMNRRILADGVLPKERPAHLRCIEMDRVTDTVWQLCGNIADLQENVYRERILRSHLEWARLKSQVAPHFLINCLYVLQNLNQSGQKNGREFSILIQTLSEHLRYSLCDRETVPLWEEVDYVRNYIQLTQVRFPGCLSYTLDIDESVRRATVFPLILLMLTENTIKYNLTMGESLEILISAKRFDKKKRPWVRLVHRDTGGGFAPEALTMLNRQRQAEEELGNASQGSHIGLYNVMKRLELCFPQSDISFYNQGGAVIEMCFPYLEYSDGEEKPDERADCG